MARRSYYRDRAGNLYRITGAMVEMHSRFLSDEWAELLLPLRHATGLRRISRLRALATVCRRRCAHAWFVWRAAC